MKARARFLPALAALLLVAGFTHLADAQSTSGTTTSGDAQTDVRAANLAAQTYHLHPTDKLHIAVPEDDKATRDVSIAMDGTVRLAYLDDPIKLAGLSVNDAIALIQKTYVDQQIFIKPQVTLEVVTYADRRINVNGQVNRPGWVNIPPEETMTLVSAISAAGGPTRIANPYVTVTRTLPNGETKVIEANLKSAMENPAKDIPIDDGDSIYVKEDSIGSVF